MKARSTVEQNHLTKMLCCGRNQFMLKMHISCSHYDNYQLTTLTTETLD